MEKYPYDNHDIYSLTVQRYLGFSAIFSRFRTKLHLYIISPYQYALDFGNGTDPLLRCRQIILGWGVQTKPWTGEDISQRSRAAYRGKIDYI